jgi:hypothetical protein
MDDFHPIDPSLKYRHHIQSQQPLLLQNVLNEITRVCTSCATASRSGRASRTRTKTCAGRATKSTKGGVSRSDRGKEDKTHYIRRIHTCLSYTSLDTISYPDRQESHYAGHRLRRLHIRGLRPSSASCSRLLGSALT